MLVTMAEKVLLALVFVIFGNQVTHCDSLLSRTSGKDAPLDAINYHAEDGRMKMMDTIEDELHGIVKDVEKMEDGKGIVLFSSLHFLFIRTRKFRSGIGALKCCPVSRLKCS